MLHGAPDGPLPVGEKDERATGVKGEHVSPELAPVREDAGQRPAKGCRAPPCGQIDYSILLEKGWNLHHIWPIMKVHF